MKIKSKKNWEFTHFGRKVLSLKIFSVKIYFRLKETRSQNNFVSENYFQKTPKRWNQKNIWLKEIYCLRNFDPKNLRPQIGVQKHF